MKKKVEELGPAGEVLVVRHFLLQQHLSVFGVRFAMPVNGLPGNVRRFD